ncbi:hypothetical protein SBV1_800011 [Verrucomicrobia bacterium]|nr:hypothetical protein SBV1_800011 [Verrucomicrobiota bacterium]
MNKESQPINQVEATAWVLIAIFLGLLILFSYLFWKQISPEFPRSSQSAVALKVAM